MTMKTTKSLLQTGALTLSLLASGVMAAVSPDEAAKLGTTLTPVGAEMAGNADFGHATLRRGVYRSTYHR